MNTRSYLFLALVVVSTSMPGCDTLMGSKEDQTTNEIFDAGRSDPQLINEVEYVALFPFFRQGGDNIEFDEPKDVYVGYDELIYVVDNRGLHILDAAGRGAQLIPIEGGGTSVIQDRKLDVYVTARRDTLLDGRVWNLPVVLRYSDLTSGAPRIANIIWHPFDDDSRRFNRPDPIDTDEEVSFTGVGVLYDNNIYVSRRGPINNRATVISPHNTIMEFNEDGINLQSIISLHPSRASLRSSLFPTDVLTFVHPPQQAFFEQSRHFVLTQSSAQDDVVTGNLPPISPLRFSTLSIRVVFTSDGIGYQPDTQLLQATSNPDNGDGFLYDEFKFTNPTGLAVASDGTNFLFVIDGGSDSLFVFTGRGVEGVTPPPGSTSSKPVVVSFGGSGDGASQFNRPQGVAYYQEIVYVADTGNNRISRYRLNTDFE